MSAFLIEDGILRRYEGRDEEVVIPEEVRSIGAWVFWSGTHLRRVTIPPGVRSIGYGAFYGCSGLTEVCIPKMVTDIASEAFAYCGKLRRIEIESKACNIKASAFKDCSEDADIYASIGCFRGAQQKRKLALTYLRHPAAFAEENAAEIRKYILAQRKALLPYIFREDLVSAVSFLADSGKIDKNNVNESFLDPANRAGAYQCVAFLLEWKNCNISFEDEEKLLEKELSKDLYNTADMGRIWSYAPLENRTLCISGYKGSDEELYIPERIGRRPVRALAEASFSPSRDSLQENTRKVLSGLRYVYIPEGVESIGDKAFFRCEGLESVEIPETVSSIGCDAFRNCPKLKDICLPPFLKSLGEAAFRSCAALEKAVIPESLCVVSDWAFSSCNELKTMDLPGSLTEIGGNAFSWTRLSDAAVPENVKRIGNNAFAYCLELKEVLLPQKLAELGAYAFRGCTSLERIVIPGTVKNIECGLLENCETLSDAVIEEGITTIGRSAFSGCSSLKSIVIPQGVEIIDNDSFSRSGLESVVIPASVKRIGRFAFSSCISLRSIEIPASVESIDPTAFDGCTGLTVYGVLGSCAEELAVRNGIEFRSGALKNDRN